MANSSAGGHREALYHAGMATVGAPVISRSHACNCSALCLIGATSAQRSVVLLITMLHMHDKVLHWKQCRHILSGVCSPVGEVGRDQAQPTAVLQAGVTLEGQCLQLLVAL